MHFNAEFRHHRRLDASLEFRIATEKDDDSAAVCFQEHPVESMSWKTWSILGLEVTWYDFQNSLCHIWPYVWCVTRAEVHLLFRHGSVPLERNDLLHAPSVIQALHGGSKLAPSHRTDMCLFDLHCLFWVDHPKHWMFGPGNLGKILWWLP